MFCVLFFFESSSSAIQFRSIHKERHRRRHVVRPFISFMYLFFLFQKTPIFIRISFRPSVCPSESLFAFAAKWTWTSTGNRNIWSENFWSIFVRETDMSGVRNLIPSLRENVCVACNPACPSLLPRPFPFRGPLGYISYIPLSTPRSSAHRFVPTQIST